MPDRFRTWLARLWRSFTGKILALLLLIVLVPLVIYQILEKADREDTLAAITSMQNSGRLIAEALRPLVVSAGPVDIPAVTEKMEELANEELHIQLLLFPTAVPGDKEFVLVAAVPTGARVEKSHILGSISETLETTCSRHMPLAIPLTDTAGEEILLTSLNPIVTPIGCWIVTVAHNHHDALNLVFNRPYWAKPEVRAVAAIYLGMVLIVIALLVAARRNLKMFEETATEIRRQGSVASFVSRNRVPELEGVAESFDDLIGSLKSSATAMRRAAEENAHAFKTPIATMAQAAEPLKRGIPESDIRLRRSLDIIERCIKHLDALVSTARRLEEASAELVNPILRPMDLSLFVKRIGATFSTFHTAKGLELESTAAPGIVIRGNEDLIEVILENLLDNAADFSPPGGIISLGLERHGDHATLTIEDAGPGCDPEVLPRLFDRYFSSRPERKDGPGDENFGIGLWLARRNAEALGGELHAENRDEGGLRLTLTLPLGKA